MKGLAPQTVAGIRDLLLARRAKLGRFIGDLIAKYKLDDFQIVGFSSMFTQNGASFAMARKLKDLNPKVIPLFTHLPPPYGAFPVRFDRFSPYFVKAKEYKLDLRQVDYYEMIYPFGEEALADIAYYFTDRNLKAEYLVTMVRWIDQVRQKYDLWKARWLNADQKLPPKLFLRADGQRGLVYDSRSGDAVERHLSEFGVQLLRYLSKPKRMADLSTLASKIPGCAPQQELMFLQERGLVFEENARYMSLAHLREPPPMTYKMGA